MILEEELNRAKVAAQIELQKDFTNDPQLMYETKADAAIMGRVYNRYDSNYFQFKAAGLDLDKNDLEFLKSYGFDITEINKKAKEILDKMEQNKNYLQHRQQIKK